VLSLTNKGVAEYKQVIKTVFAFINQVKLEKP
jgi:secreted Zn-dependent insulinase-like peptidase